jgi:hypothetical protein
MRPPIWWDTQLTIYNQYKDPLTSLVSWFRNVVSNCFWKYTGNQVTVGDVELKTNTTICRIPKDDRFKERYLWEALPNDQMSQYFTLSPGDIIVKGSVSDVIDEQLKGHRSTDLIAKYKRLQGCIEIQSWADNTGVGRNDKHYYITGE